MREALPCRVLGLLVATVALALAMAATAGAQSRIHNWPNSPLRHPLHRSAPNPSPSFTADLRGSTAVAGNTLLTCPTNTPPRRGRPRSESEPCLNENNNNHDMRYVNVDPGNGRFDSSSATLAVPADARVVRAYLYWGADLARGVERPPNDASDDAPGGADPDANTLWKQALLRVGAGSYTTIDATADGRGGRWNGVDSWYSQPGHAPGFAYQVRADVTPEVSGGIEATRRRSPRGNRLLSVTVANVQAGKGYNRHGGWTLLVVWQSPSAPWRNVTLFDGFAFVQVQGGEQLVVGPLDFTGFETPASGDVDAHVTSWTYEGDRAITGDYMALGGVNSACADLRHLSDAVNPVNNFFNSTISRAGVTVGGRAPGYDNQMGFDLDALAVPEGTIPNAATGASVCLGTVGDTYFFGGIAFDTLIRAPNLKIAKVADPTQANPGDTVTYTTEVSNPQRPAGEEPTSAATNLVVADPLPAGLDFVGFATNPGNACGYDATTRTIRCTKDRLDPDETFTYAYRARVSAAAQGDAPATLRNVACFESNSEDRPHDVYYGCDPATVIVPPVVPPPPTADLGVVKTVSHAVVAPGDTVTWRVVGTNYGPATSTGFVLADQLPGRIAFVSATPSPGLTCTTPAVGAAGAVRCSAPSVPAGSSLSVTITGRVPPGTPNGAVLRNVATVNGDQAEPLPDPHPNRDYTLTRVLVPDRPQPPPHPPIVPDPIGPVEPPVVTPPAPAVPGGLAGTRLRLRKRATPSHVARGDRVTFRLRVSNVGEAQARKVRVCDVLPRGLALVSASHFRVKGRVLCAYPGRIGVGASRGYRITARATGGARLVNRAAVRSADAPVARARAAVRVIAPRFTG